MIIRQFSVEISDPGANQMQMICALFFHPHDSSFPAALMFLKRVSDECIFDACHRFRLTMCQQANTKNETIFLTDSACKYVDAAVFAGLYDRQDEGVSSE